MDNRKEFQYPYPLMPQDVYSVVEMIAGMSDNSDMYLCISGTRSWVCSNVIVNHTSMLTQVDGYELVGQGGKYELRKDSTYSQHLLQNDANVQNLKVRFPNRQSAKFTELLSMMKALDGVTYNTEERFSASKDTYSVFRRAADMQVEHEHDRIMFDIACSSKLFMGEEMARSRARRLENERTTTMKKGSETIYDFCITILNLRASFAADLQNRMRGVPILRMDVNRSTRLEGYVSAILPGSFLMVKSAVYKKVAVVRRDTEDTSRYHYNIARIYHDPSSISTEERSSSGPVPLIELCTTIRKRMNQYHPNRQNQRMKVKGHDTTFMSLYDLVKSQDWQIIDEGAIKDGHILVNYSTPLNTITENDGLMHDIQKIMTPDELQRISQDGNGTTSATRTALNVGVKGAAAAGSLYTMPYVGQAASAASTLYSPVVETGMVAASGHATWGTSLATTAGVVAPHIVYMIAAVAGAVIVLGGAYLAHNSAQKSTETFASWIGNIVSRFKGGDDARYEAAKEATNGYDKKAAVVKAQLSNLDISVVFPAESHDSDRLSQYIEECRTAGFFNDKTDGTHEKSVKEAEFRAAFNNMVYVLTIYQIVQKGDLLWSIIQSGNPCEEAKSIFEQYYEITCQLIIEAKVNATGFGHMLV